jgi:uncharacterized paraquat-inducible protein A
MAIRVSCPSCGERLSAPDSHAGKVARCPACKNVIQVPSMYLKPPKRVPNASVLDELY